MIVIQGLLGPAIGALFGWGLALLSAERATAGWERVASVSALVAVLVFLILSLLLRSLRRLFWGGVRRLLQWCVGLRVTTRRRREGLLQSGYEKRNAEIKDERKHSPRPCWRVTHQVGEDWIYVHNSGYWVDDVTVEADPQLFVFANGTAQTFMAGRFGDNMPGTSTGRQVAGKVTERGEREGVTFRFSWRDQRGDAQPSTETPDLSAMASLPARML